MSLPTCPCGCFVNGESVRTDVKHWQIALIERRPGPYPYRVTGVNLYIAPGGYGRHFTWDVPSLDDAQFDLSNAVTVANGPGRCDNRTDR